MTIALMLIAIGVLMAIRVPVALSILGPSLVYMLATGNSPGFAMRIASDGSLVSAACRPTVYPAGIVANYSGVANRLFEFAESLPAPYYRQPWLRQCHGLRWFCLDVRFRAC